MVREIVFDTETTGFNPEKGDKLVEIGAIELINHVPTRVTFHRYINPQREVPEEALSHHRGFAPTSLRFRQYTQNFRRSEKADDCQTD